MKYDFERLSFQKDWLSWSKDKHRLANFSTTGSG